MAKPEQDDEGSLTIVVHKEIAHLVHRMTKHWRARHGLKANGARYSMELERVMMWLVELVDDDIDRIFAEGEPGVARFRALPLDYDPNTWEGERPLKKRAASVFGRPSVVEEPPKPAGHQVKGKPGKRNTGEHGGKGQDATPVVNDRPRR